MTYCFDLDNTLLDTKKHPTEKRWDYLGATPIQHRINLVNRLYDGGSRIIINTARGTLSGKDWLPDTMLQLHALGIMYHELHVGIKPVADLYIDDKGISDIEFFKEWE